MSLRFDGADGEPLDRSVVSGAVAAVTALVRRPEVAASWQQESACEGMTVGGLTWHLISQPGLVVSLLEAHPEAGAGKGRIDVLEHYARATWVSEDLDGDANRTIRSTSDEQASAGVEAAMSALDDARSRLAAALAAPPDTVFIGWQGWSLRTDDFLVTRLMEMVVHSDDLAASVDVTTPSWEPGVLEPVLRLLSALSLRRHGQDALVRALSRPQRAGVSIAAF